MKWHVHDYYLIVRVKSLMDRATSQEWQHLSQHALEHYITASFNLQVVKCWFRLDHLGSVECCQPNAQLPLSSCLRRCRGATPSPLLTRVLTTYRHPHYLMLPSDPCHTLQITSLMHGGRSRNYCRAKRWWLFSPTPPLLMNWLQWFWVYYPAKYSQWLDSAYLEKCLTYCSNK